MIDEKKLIENLKDFAQDEGSKAIYGDKLRLIIGDCIIEVENQPKVGKWIPCTEQLPNKVESYYIVSVKSAVSGLVYTRPALYDNHGFSTKLDEEVIAWQPLPEPYRGEGEGRNE